MPDNHSAAVGIDDAHDFMVPGEVGAAPASLSEAPFEAPAGPKGDRTEIALVVLLVEGVAIARMPPGSSASPPSADVPLRVTAQPSSP